MRDWKRSMTNEKLTLSEHEAIILTTQYGFEGEELNTSKWKQRGCLQMDRTQKGLMSKLQTIFNTVEITGKGKKRQYILSDKNEVQSEREYSYRSFATSPEGKVMIDYIYEQLLDILQDELSITSWVKMLNLPEVSMHTSEMAIEKMQSFYGEHLSSMRDKIIKDVVNNLIDNVDTRNIDIVKNAFNHLQKIGVITLTDVYYFMMADGDLKAVTQLEYENLQQELKAIVQSTGADWNSYLSARRFTNYYTKQLKECSILVKKHLSAHGIDYEFKRVSVTILDNDTQRDTFKGDIYRAWCDDIIRLATNRQKKPKYSESQYLGNRLVLLNTLILLEPYLNEQQRSVMETEIKLLPEKFNLMWDIFIRQEARAIEEKMNRYNFESIEHNA